MKNYIHLEIELSALKNFLDCVLRETGTEIELLSQQFDGGKFLVIDDYYNALFYPITRQEIAIRAVLYELTALVENELQSFAHQAWLNSEKYKGPKSLIELSELPRSGIKSLKMISDINFQEVLNLIKKAPIGAI